VAAPRPGPGRVAPFEQLSVLIADGDPTSRRAVREALEAHGFVVVAETSDLTSTVSLASGLRPDICLLEIELPGHGPTAIGKITKASPQTMVIVLSGSDRQEDVVASFTRGASGYLLKGLSGESLASTLRAAFGGEPALSRSLVPYLVDEIRRGSTRRLALPDGPVTLTPREWEVAELLRDGNSTLEIAGRLGVSPVTVRRHVGLLLRKLGATSREDAVGMIRAHGRR